MNDQAHLSASVEAEKAAARDKDSTAAEKELFVTEAPRQLPSPDL